MASLLLIGLDLLRIAFRGRSIEAHLSAGLLPIVLIAAGWGSHYAMTRGWPVWGLAFGIFSALIYTFCCGRDYSFVGCYCISVIPSSVMIAGYSIWASLPASTAGWALAINAVYLFYFIYDLASLLARRRESESLAAVTDLYRDVFNFAGYFYRCVIHWRKHHIWVAPR